MTDRRSPYPLLNPTSKGWCALWITIRFGVSRRVAVLGRVVLRAVMAQVNGRLDSLRPQRQIVRQRPRQPVSRDGNAAAQQRLRPRQCRRRFAYALIDVAGREVSWLGQELRLDDRLPAWASCMGNRMWRNLIHNARSLTPASNLQASAYQFGSCRCYRPAVPQYFDDSDYYSEPAQARTYAPPPPEPPRTPRHRSTPALLAAGAVAVIVIAVIVYAGLKLTTSSSPATVSTTTQSSASTTTSAGPIHRMHNGTTVITQGPQTITEEESAPATDTGTPAPTNDAGTPQPSTVTVTQSTDTPTTTVPSTVVNTSTLTQTVTVSPQRPFFPRPGA